MIERVLDGAPPRTAVPPGATDTQVHAYLPGPPARAGGPPLPPALPGPGDYRRVMRRLGIGRVVVTQGNAYQFDNACLVECLGVFGDIARGVAVVTADTTDGELERLHAAGVRGARVMDLPGGAVGIDRLTEVDAVTAPLGWCIAVQFDGNRIADHAAALRDLRSRYVIDHHGKFFAGASPDGPEAAIVKTLLDRGNCWFKFAGCYESSRDGAPRYADVAALSAAIARHAPERIVWGTNWPHNMITRSEDYPDDARLLDLVLGWLPSDEARRLALVDNPAALFGFDTAART